MQNIRQAMPGAHGHMFVNIKNSFENKFYLTYML